MNFEVFDTEEQLQARVAELQGIASEILINPCNGNGCYVLKWKEA